MASSINASTAGVGGVITTADNTGILNIQTAGATAVTIDASQRASFVAGTAAAPAITTTGDTNTGMFFPAADTIAFSEGGAESMRIDASGNVGIGTTSPSYKLHVVGGQVRFDVSSAGTSLVCLGTGSNFQVDHSTSGYATLINSANTGAAMIFKGSSESMRIDTSGNLQIGTATAGAIVPAISLVRGGTTWQLGPSVPSGGGNTFYVVNSGGTGVYIVSGNTSWTASSDERLKTDLKPIENAAEKVSTLRSVTGRFKTDDEGVSRSFLIAQDVQAVLPEAVNVQDDEQGTLGVQYTDVIPLLVAAIKELKAEIDLLKGVK
jgi:hypothetical protein